MYKKLTGLFPPTTGTLNRLLKEEGYELIAIVYNERTAQFESFFKRKSFMTIYMEELIRMYDPFQEDFPSDFLEVYRANWMKAISSFHRYNVRIMG